jgi:indole-3-glycerol phosphate synthase
MDILREIVEHKRAEVESRRRARPLSLDDVPARSGHTAPMSDRGGDRSRLVSDRRDFRAALASPGIAVIAEFKRRSPSKGVLREAADVRAIAAAYRDNGAAALSILTDRKYFGGDDRDLREARDTAGLPALRKDFVVDEYQIYESAVIGADAVLLIARILGDAELRDLLDLARRCDLAALVETHSRQEVERAVAANAAIIGVNSRDLDTFEVSLDTALQLRTMIPDDCVTVAESGIHTRADVARVAAAGYDAVLVGESLMRSPDPGRKLAELLGRSS